MCGDGSAHRAPGTPIRADATGHSLRPGECLDRHADRADPTRHVLQGHDVRLGERLDQVDAGMVRRLGEILDRWDASTAAAAKVGDGGRRPWGPRANMMMMIAKGTAPEERDTEGRALESRHAERTLGGAAGTAAESGDAADG